MVAHAIKLEVREKKKGIFKGAEGEQLPLFKLGTITMDYIYRNSTQFYRIKFGGGLGHPREISRFYEHFKKFREICFAHIFAKFEYFTKVIIYSKSLGLVLLNDI